MDQQLADLVRRHLVAENGQDLTATSRTSRPASPGMATRAPRRTIANGGPPST